MKIEKITIHNIASIADAVIDFNQKPLVDNNLFLICGETGVGKTTILDAISLALFGKTPRFNKNISSRDAIAIDGLASDKVVQIMRRHTTQAFVELNFSVDNQPYCATWEAHRAYNAINGTLLINLSLRIGDKVIQNKVPQLIEEIIGLTFEQFCRTTMLAQGEFTKFMFSDDNDKASILEKLTNTEQYTRYGKRIFDETNKKEKLHKDEYAKIKAIEETLLTQEHFLEIQQKISDLKKSEKTTDEEYEIINKKNNWLLTREELRNKLDKTTREWEQLQTQISAHDFKETEKLITDWDNTGKARETLNSWNVNEQKIKSNVNSLDQLKTDFATLSGNYNYLKATILTLSQQKNAKENYLHQQQPLDNMLRQSQTIVSELKSIIRLGLEIDKEAQQKITNENALPNLEKLYQSAKTATAQANTSNQKKQTEINQKKEELQQKNIQSLEKEKEKQQELLTIINETERAYQVYSEKKKELRMESDNQANLEKEILENNNKTAELRKNLEATQTAYNDAESLYQKTLLSVNDAAKTLRQQLKVNDKCPVCGHLIDSILQDDAFAKALEPILQKQQQQKQIFDEAQELFNKSLYLMDLQKKQRQQIEEKINQATADCEQKNKDFITHCHQCGIDEMSANLNDIFFAKKKRITQTIAALTAQLNTCHLLQNEINRLQKEKDEITQKGFDTAQKQEHNSWKQWEKTKSNIEKSTSLISSYKNQTNDIYGKIQAIISYPDWQKEWESNATQFIQKLESDAGSYLQTIQDCSKIENDLRILQNTQNQIDTVKNQILTTLPEWGTILPCQSTEEPNLAAKWNRLNTDVTALNRAIEETSAILKTNEQQLEMFYAANSSINSTRLQELCNYSDHSILTKRNHIATQKENLKVKEGEKKAAESGIISHDEKKMPLEETDTPDRLKQLLDELETTKKSTQEEKGKLIQLLQSDQENRGKIAEQKQKCDLLLENWKKWENMNKVFGDKEGTKFRKMMQSFVLKQLLSGANYYLERLSNRYKLDSTGFLITIIDNYENDAVRPVNTLSGGESFLVSLALALGLSNINKQGLPVEMLFIDEGFGTLSGEHLNTVMNALEHLNANGSRKIGIISHVEGLRERIKTHIEVSRNGHEASNVKVVG